MTEKNPPPPHLEKDPAPPPSSAECPWLTWPRKIRSFFPPEVETHLRNARREMLLAVKAAVEARLASLDQAAPPETRRIEIE